MKEILRRMFPALLVLLTPQFLFGQQPIQKQIDSILQKLPSFKADTNLANAYEELSYDYATSFKSPEKTDPNIIKAVYYANKEINLALKLKNNKELVHGYTNLGLIYRQISDFEQAIVADRKAFGLAKNQALKDEAGGGLASDCAETCRKSVEEKNIQQSKVLIERSVSYLKKLGNAVAIEQFYSNVALIYTNTKTEYEQSIRYYQLSLASFKADDHSDLRIATLQDMALRYRSGHRLVDELGVLQLTQKLITRKNTPTLVYAIDNILANLYDDIGEYSAALEVRKKTLDLVVPPFIKPIITFALGREYLRLHNYKQAFYYDNLALQHAGKGLQASVVQTEMASAYFLQKNYDRAFTLLKQSDALNTNSVLLAGLYRDAPDSLLKKYGLNTADKYPKAEKMLVDFVQASKRSGVFSQRTNDLYENLYLLYDKMKDYPKAYAAYQNYIGLRDSLLKLVNKSAVVAQGTAYAFKQREDSIKTRQEIASAALQNQLALTAKDKQLQAANFKQSQTNLTAEQNKRKANLLELSIEKGEIQKKQTQTYYLFAGIAALLGLSFFIAQNYRNQRKANKLISYEKARSEDLLLNILPADVAEELKEKGSADARHFDEVTVLFSDFVNFTLVSELLSPQELVNELNICFKAFDEIMTTFGIEKIKTIGDAYLAVAGLPLPNNQHASKVINAAKEIQQFMLKRKQEIGDKTFGIRIGIHSGSVVAGIVGVKKFAYDIWGDTVNTAARMEQNSQPGKINVSEKTYELVKDEYDFTYRGEIEAKNKGMMKMYFAN